MQSTSRPTTGIPRSTGISKPSGIPAARSTRPVTSSSLPSSTIKPPSAPTQTKFAVKDINLSASSTTLKADTNVRSKLQTTRTASSSSLSIQTPAPPAPALKKVSSPGKSSPGAKVATKLSPSKLSSPKAASSPKSSLVATESGKENSDPYMVPTKPEEMSQKDLEILQLLSNMVKEVSGPTFFDDTPLNYDYNDDYSYELHCKLHYCTEYFKAMNDEYLKSVDQYGARLIFDEDSYQLDGEVNLDTLEESSF